MDHTDLSRFIEDNEIEGELLLLEGDTPTVADAAAVMGVQPEQIAKSVLFIADGQPVLVLASGFTRVNPKALADHLGVARRRVRVASADKVLAITGYPAGAVPPFGHRSPLPTILEAGLTAQQEMLAGGGAINALLRISLAQLVSVVGDETADLAG